MDTYTQLGSFPLGVIHPANKPLKKNSHLFWEKDVQFWPPIIQQPLAVTVFITKQKYYSHIEILI